MTDMRTVPVSVLALTLTQSSSSYWPNLPIISEGVLLSYGAYLAWTGRDHPTLFNER